MRNTIVGMVLVVLGGSGLGMATQFLLDVNFIANINHYTLLIRLLPDQTIEVTADEASGLIRNGRLIGTPAAR